MLTYPLEERGTLPLYEYLYRRIRADILSGALAAGERLPSKRRLAEHLHVSVITVEGAYAQLIAEGYVFAAPKRGVFVSRVERLLPPPSAGSAPPELSSPAWRLDLKSNRIDAGRFPFATWSRLTRQVLSEEDTALLSPVPNQGLLELRRAIAEDLRDYRGLSVSPGQIVVGAGAEYLYLLLVQLLGRESVFAVEDPGYPKLSRVYASCGAGRHGAESKGSAGLGSHGGPHLSLPPLSHRAGDAHPAAAGAAALGGGHRRVHHRGRL